MPPRPVPSAVMTGEPVNVSFCPTTSVPLVIAVTVKVVVVCEPVNEALGAAIDPVTDAPLLRTDFAVV